MVSAAHRRTGRGPAITCHNGVIGTPDLVSVKPESPDPRFENNPKSEVPTTESSFRLFVAALAPEEVRKEIGKAQEELRGALPDGCIRWTKSEQLHLTLKFLGNVAVKHVESLTGSIRSACGQFAPLRLRARQVGFFPDRGFPRVLWVGVEDEEGRLPLLQRAIETAWHDLTAEEGAEKFTGHITLGRVKLIRRAEAEILSRAKARMAGRVFGEWTAEQVDLMRSELASAGARHESLAAIRLGELA